MPNEKLYDVAIIGGGLAGLSLSILLAREKYKVVLIEKEKYPFHKVCGEYVSLESWNFLKHLGLPLEQMNLPLIDSLQISAPGGAVFDTKLPLGGFGISRALLDSSLASIAKTNGVELLEQTKADYIIFDKNKFEIKISSTSGVQQIGAAVCCAAYGKRSNIDIKWKRKFLGEHRKKPQNYIAVKYHLRIARKPNVIGLHNFRNGYCGISKIEGDYYCLCYLTTAEELKKAGNNISVLEKNLLYRNVLLEKLFTESTIIENFPITISQINFTKKTQIENNVIMIGDAAGTITPLCGNGMSMALHSSKICARLVSTFLKKDCTRDELNSRYKKQWNAHFSARLSAGRLIQHFFGQELVSRLFIQFFKIVPFMARNIIRRTHGKPF
jgi:flavin-dependent dehydrogenase